MDKVHQKKEIHNLGTLIIANLIFFAMVIWTWNWDCVNRDFRIKGM